MLEVVVIQLISEPNRLPVRTLKPLFRTTPVVSAFNGNELVSNLATKVQTDRREALHIASQLYKYGYLYAVEQSVSALKDDSTLYRMQAEDKWPSQRTSPNNIDYATFLEKKLQLKQKLAEHEEEAYERFNVTYARSWTALCKKAQEEISAEEKEPKETRVVLQGEERAFWYLHRPPPGEPLVMESSIQKRNVNRSELSEFEVVQDLEIRIDVYRRAAKRNRVKCSHSADLIIGNVEKISNLDPFLKKSPSNPWSNDKLTHGSNSNDKFQAWSVSFECLIKDTDGRDLFMEFLKSEVSTENLTFCEEVSAYKTLPISQLNLRAPQIFKRYIGPTARSEINIDGKTFRLTKERMERPDRYTFDLAQNYIYDLMRKDSYSRFLKSHFYTEAAKKHTSDKKVRRISKLTSQPLNAQSIHGHRASMCESNYPDVTNLAKSNSMDALNEVSSIVSPTHASVTGSHTSIDDETNRRMAKLYRNSSGTDMLKDYCIIPQMEDEVDNCIHKSVHTFKSNTLISPRTPHHNKQASSFEEKSFSAPPPPDLKNFPKPRSYLSQDEGSKTRQDIFP